MSINQYSDEDDILIKGDDGTTAGKKIGVVSDALKVYEQNVPLAVTSNGGVKTTYSAASSGFTPAANATDIFIITGSATKTVKIISVSFSATTTAGSGVSINTAFVKRSSANSGGTSTVATNVPHDSTSGAATATVRSYTANPTVGAAVGTVACLRYNIPTIGSVGAGAEAPAYRFGQAAGQPIVLRGTNESLAINFGGAAITNPVACCTVEWVEE